MFEKDAEKWFEQLRQAKVLYTNENVNKQLHKAKEELKEENRILGERCNQLLKDKGNLTDKIDDIKANCNLAIEGRDIKIIELEKENAELKELKKKKEEIEIMTNFCATCKKMHTDQLIKAKEIIKTLVDDLSVYSGNYQKELLDAEQFLKV